MDKWLRNNNVIRIIAISVGLMLWMFVRLNMQDNTSTTQANVSQTHTNVAVEVQGLDEDRFILRSIQPEKVSMTITGTTAALRRVDDNYRVVLDLSDALPGETLMPLVVTGLPNNVDVVLDPPNVLVTLDEIIQKEVPVTIERIGNPAAGFVAGEPIVQPNRVLVTVPGSMADQVASVVGIVDIDGANGNVRKDVRLTALDQEGAELDVKITPAVAEVEVPVTLPFKTVPLRVELEGEVPEGFAIAGLEQNVSEVTVYAPQSVLNTLEYYDGVSVDVSRMRETSTVPITIPLKQGVEQVQPEEATVEIRIVESAVTSLTVPLSLLGARDEFEYIITLPDEADEQQASRLDVTVEAAPNIIANLREDDVQASIMVGALPPGVYEMQVQYTLPPFVKKPSEAADIVTVEVREKGEAASTEPDSPSEPADEKEPEGETSGGEADPEPTDAEIPEDSDDEHQTNERPDERQEL